MSRSWKPWLAVLLVLGTCALLQAANPNNRSVSHSGVLAQKPPTSVTPPPPDPNVIRQGGDTCATAFVIPSPLTTTFTDDGTTVGYTNDYDEVCPYSGSTSPDVVYSYTPAANQAIDVTLCTGTTNYDTKLYIYAGSCPNSPPLACNDDSCSSPLFSSYVSSLSNVSLTGGTTYYIVVDGYGGNSGPYTINVSPYVPPPPPAECAGTDLLYYQTVADPASSWNAFTSGQTTSFNYTVYDNFDGSTMASINAFHWWGLSLLYSGGWNACDPTGVTFDVRFYQNNAGQPGTEVCTYAAVAPAMTNTGISYSGYTLFYWELASLSPACTPPAGPAWVSVKSLTNTGDCAFLWMNGTGGDSSAWQFDGSAYTALAYDMAMCINGVPVPVELQSFTAQ